MLKFIRLLALLVVAAVFSVLTVHAQEGTIVYGDIVEGEMTEDQYEFVYTFEGEAGDVIVILLEPVEQFGDLLDPIMILTSADGEVVGDTSNAFVFGTQALAAELPDDGEYELLVTRLDGADGESVGEFTLELINLEVLEAGTAVEGEIDSDSRTQYYAVKSDGEFGIRYVKHDGDMELQITLNTIDDYSSGLSEIASIEGQAVTEATIGVFESGTYIVTVGEPLFSFSFSRETAEYALELVSFD